MRVQEHMSAEQKVILVCVLDAVKKKDLRRFKGLAEFGYRFIVISSDSTSNSAEVCRGQPYVDFVPIGDDSLAGLRALCIVLRNLLFNRPDLMELYPYGVIQLLCAVFSKIARVPIVIVARGQEKDYIEKRMSLRARLSFRATYWVADYVIYKEYYMEKMLNEMGKTKRWMLPNAVEIPTQIQRHTQDKCYLLLQYLEDILVWLKRPKLSRCGPWPTCRQY